MYLVIKKFYSESLMSSVRAVLHCKVIISTEGVKEFSSSAMLVLQG